MEYTKMTYAQAIQLGLEEKLNEDIAVFLMGEDIGHYGGAFGITKGLLEKFGETRVRDIPISEAAMAGTAIGAAICGMRPVIEVMFSDFLTLTMDQIVNMAAKARYMYGGQFSVPLVLRAPSGSGTGAGAQHSQSLESWFCHVPGLKVVAPSTPDEARSLIRAAVEDPDPVIFFEQKLLYESVGDVSVIPTAVPIGKAVVKREGSDLSVITYGRMVGCCLEVAHEMEKHGIYVEVLDLRTLLPLDMKAIQETVHKTGRVLIVHEACKTGGVGAEVVARICEDAKMFACLKMPVARCCGKDIPMPYSVHLEKEAIPTLQQLTEQIKFMFS